MALLARIRTISRCGSRSPQVRLQGAGLRLGCGLPACLGQVVVISAPAVSCGDGRGSGRWPTGMHARVAGILRFPRGAGQVATEFGLVFAVAVSDWRTSSVRDNLGEVLSVWKVVCQAYPNMRV